MSFGIFTHEFDIAKSGTIKLKSSVSPTDAEHLANKQYVDAAVATGAGDWLASVLAQQDAPPSTPSTNDRYLIGSSPSGAWSSNANNVAEWNGAAWAFTAPSNGTHVFIEGGSSNAGNAMIYNGSAWVVLGNATGALLKSNNLSDLDNVSTAKSNLGLGSLADKSSVDLAADVTGTLPVSSGGTGSTSAPMVGVITAADAAAAKTVLGIGSIASQSASNVSITGGSITGITDLAVADGGTGASTAADARTNLGLGTAAVEDTGVAAGDIVKLDAALDVSEVVGRVTDEAIVFTSNTNMNYMYAGGSWTVSDSTPTQQAAGDIVEIDSANNRIFVTVTSGYLSSSFAGYTFESSGYSLTLASSPQAYVTRNRGLAATDLRTIIGGAGAGDSAQYTTKGVAAFHTDDFSSSSGFITLSSGLNEKNVVKLFAGVSSGDLLKAANFTYSVASGSFISSGAIDTTAKTIKTQTDMSNIQAGQSIASSGYSFVIESISSDGASTPTYTVTVADPNSYLQYLYDGASFTVASGSGFISAGAYGDAANESVASALASSASKLLKVGSSNLASGDVLSVDSSSLIVAKTLGTAADEDVATALNDTNGKLLKVASGANLQNNNLLKINSSGEIEGTTEAGSGTVTSIALADDDGDTTTAITSSGSIAVVGDGTIITTNVNGSSQLEIAVADASSSQKGVVQLASSSSYSGSVVASVNLSSGGSLGAGGLFTLNSSAEWTEKTVTGHDISGPGVINGSGIATSVASLPAAVANLDGIYTYNLSASGSAESVTLPASTSSSDVDTVVRFKIQGLHSSRSLAINAGAVSGGGKMLIDGLEQITLDQNMQSVTLHLAAVMSSDGSSTNEQCWSIL